jgi:hypothetical protein
MDEQQHAEREPSREEERAAEPAPGDQEPFDENPPVDPAEPQVGNSRARFFMPREDADEEREEEEEASQDVEGGEHSDEESASG